LPGETTFLTFPGYGADPPMATDIDAWVQTILDACLPPAHVIAHSYGGIAAILAASSRPNWCRSLLLFEPAAYSLARGQASIEEHIRRLTPIMDEAPQHDAATFWPKFMTALTGSTPPAPSTPAALVVAERFRLLTPPWSHHLPNTVFKVVPTLVVTGDWNPEYEDIARSLVRFGAEHRHLVGHGHRLVDHAAANELIEDWASSHG
jgi:pimeloyl-ACP methyl ester carboxylesterase